MAGLPVPNPATAVPGEFLTSALWNAQVRDAVGFLTHVPVFSAQQTVQQSYGSNSSSPAPVLLDSETLDSDGGHSTTTSTSRYTVQTAGIYSAIGTVAFVTAATGSRAVLIAVNGVAVRQTVLPTLATGNTWSGQCSWMGPLSVGDYVEMWAWQTSGGNLLTSNNPGLNPSLTLHWVSA